MSKLVFWIRGTRSLENFFSSRILLPHRILGFWIFWMLDLGVTIYFSVPNRLDQSWKKILSRENREILLVQRFVFRPLLCFLENPNWLPQKKQVAQRVILLMSMVAVWLRFVTFLGFWCIPEDPGESRRGQ